MPRVRDLVRVALVFAVAFAALVWLYPRVLPAYEHVVLALARPWLGAGEPPIEIAARPDGALEAWIRGKDGLRHPLTGAPYQPFAIFGSLVLVPALVIATPLPLRRRALLAALSLGLLVLVHLVALVALFRGQLCLALAPGTPSCVAVTVLAATSAQTGGVALWAALTWWFWVPRRERAAVRDAA